MEPLGRQQIAANDQVSALAIWEEDRNPKQQVQWARDFAAAIEPLSSGGYVNYLGPDTSPDQVRAAYGPQKYQRLVDLKTKYDPSNMFRFNSNIPRSRSAEAPARSRLGSLALVQMYRLRVLLLSNG